MQPDKLAHLAVVVELDDIDVVVPRDEFSQCLLKWQRAQTQIVGRDALLVQAVARLRRSPGSAEPYGDQCRSTQRLGRRRPA